MSGYVQPSSESSVPCDAEAASSPGAWPAPASPLSTIVDRSETLELRELNVVNSAAPAEVRTVSFAEAVSRQLLNGLLASSCHLACLCRAAQGGVQLQLMERSAGGHARRERTQKRHNAAKLKRCTPGTSTLTACWLSLSGSGPGST